MLFFVLVLVGTIQVCCVLFLGTTPRKIKKNVHHCCCVSKYHGASLRRVIHFVGGMWPIIYCILYLDTQQIYQTDPTNMPNLNNNLFLQVLSLHDIKLGVEGSEALGPYVSKLASLQQLDISNNSIGHQGTIALEPHLAQATSLQSLNLSNNNIGSDGARALGHSLWFLTALNSLNISNNTIGSKGAKAIGPSLVMLPYLEVLDVSTNSIGDKGVKAMEPFLTTMRSLKDLSLGWNKIGEGMLGFSNVKGKLRKKLSFVENLGL